MEGNARTWFTPKQRAELWERWKSGQCVADIAVSWSRGPLVQRCIKQARMVRRRPPDVLPVPGVPDIDGCPDCFRRYVISRPEIPQCCGLLPHRWLCYPLCKARHGADSAPPRFRTIQN
jgi:hypothetical protein